MKYSQLALEYNAYKDDTNHKECSTENVKLWYLFSLLSNVIGKELVVTIEVTII